MLGYCHMSLGGPHLILNFTFPGIYYDQSTAAKTRIMVFWWSAMALKEQNQITINTGLSRTGINCPKYLYLKLKRESFLESVFG